MMRIIIVLAVNLLILTGCSSDFDKFNRQALSYASNDKKIDPKEFGELLTLIKESKDKRFDTFKTSDLKVDGEKLAAYLLKYFAAQKIDLTKADIWQPTLDVQNSERLNINLFIENSGSMNGYLKDPNTQFKNSIYSLLTRLKLFVDKDSLNLFFINQDDQLLCNNATNSDIEGFKDILNPSSFARISKAKTNETDVNDMIKRCLEKVNDCNMSIFISDCIYSPGKKRPDASMYLSEQKHGIFLNFATEIKARNNNLAVIVLQMKGGFKGKYYNRLNESVTFEDNIERPFYVWIIGSKEHISKLVKSKLLEEIDGRYTNKMILQIGSGEPVRYKIMANPLFGSFDRKSLAKNIIENPTASTNGQNSGLFGFTIAVDFSECIQDEKYCATPSHYVLSNPNYTLSIEPIKDKSNSNLQGFTHLLKLQTKEIKTEALNIELIGKTPDWIYDYTSKDDLYILTNKSEQEKTFGLSYLVEGVSEAFYPKSKTNAICKISITINK